MTSASRLNGVIRAWESGKPAFASFASADRTTAIAFSTSPYDGLVFEMEHNPWDPNALQDALQYLLNRAQIAKSGSVAPGVTPFVRIPPNGDERNQWVAKQALDRGAYEIVWPHIETVEQATNAVAACRYPRPKGSPRYEPAGLRGDGPTSACRYWGLSQKEYYAKADVWPLDPDGEIVVMLMIEDTPGIQNLRDILKNVPGVGGILIGEGDLSQELGVPRQYDHPEVRAAMAEVVAVRREFNVPVGHPHVGNDNVERVFEEGYRFLMASPVRSLAPLEKGRKLSGADRQPGAEAQPNDGCHGATDMELVRKVPASQTSIQALADWSLRDEPAYYSDLVARQARLLVLDTIGCAIAGSRSDVAAAVLDLMLDSGGAPQCTIIGSQVKTSLTNAVLVNGVKVRCLDLNDVIFIQKEGKLSVGGHPSDNIPVALSTGEMIGSTLGQVLEAIVVGYQMFSRLRDVMRFSSLWDGTSSSGIVAAAMAGRLLGLDAKRQAHALAFAAARCATPKVVRWGALSSVKNMANALVAQSGVQAALLAARGLTGPMEVLDHEGGLRQLFDPALGFEQLWAAPPPALQVMSANIKTFPCIGTAQALVAAALALAPKLEGRHDQIRRIEAIMADLPMVVNQQAELTRRQPRTREDADHSFTFLAAVALVDGELTERQFADKRWLQPEMRSLTQKVELKTSPEIVVRAPDSMPARVEVHLEGGERLVSECLYPPGHSFPERGLDRDVTVSKFRGVTQGILGAGAANEILSLLLDGARTQSVSALFGKLRSATTQDVRSA